MIIGMRSMIIGIQITSHTIICVASCMDSTLSLYYPITLLHGGKIPLCTPSAISVITNKLYNARILDSYIYTMIVIVYRGMYISIIFCGGYN